MESAFTEALLTTLKRFYEGAMQFLPSLLAALVIIVAGWAMAWASKLVVRRALLIAKFDHFCANAGASQVLSRADIHAPPSTVVGRSVFWLVWVVFLMTGVSALGLEVFNRLISEFFLYLPQAFAAVLILLLGFLIGNFLSRAALLAAVNAQVASPRIISSMVRFLITILASAMALEQLHIARNIVVAAFAIAFGAVMLGLAIAFGLGGREVARHVLEQRFLQKKGEEPDEFSHI
ncbi:MAG: hypothetical protein HY652_05460 [Acidobacteria bacterium]|nr:hypothetical protein [Acidobacteriota bacterium]